MHPTPDTAGLITSPEAAQILGRSTRTIHRLVETGELHPVRRMSTGPNGAYIFNATEVHALADIKRSARKSPRRTA